jgi:hypothetical protein
MVDAALAIIRRLERQADDKASKAAAKSWRK